MPRISCLQNTFPLNQVLAIIGSRFGSGKSGPLAEGRWFFCNKVTCCTKTNGRRSRRSGQKVQDKSEMRNTDGSGVLNKKRPIYCTKCGRFLAQKTADLLNKKRPLSSAKIGRLLAQKMADLLHKMRPLYCTKNGRFLAQNSAAFLH